MAIDVTKLSLILRQYLLAGLPSHRAVCFAGCIAEHLRQAGFEVAAGQIAIDGKALRGLMAVLRSFDPSLFVTLEDLRTVQAGVFPVGKLPGVTESISEALGESLSLPPQGKTNPAPDDGACLPVTASACCGGQPGVRK